MGNVHTIIREQHVESEFERVKKKSNNNDYLTVDEAKKLHSLEDLPIDFKKLAVLFMLDVDKNGKFSMDDLMKFSNWCAQVTSNSFSNGNNNNNNSNGTGIIGNINHNNGMLMDQQSFKSEIQAQCTLHMWKQINTENGKQAFSDWFVRLFSTGMVVRVNNNNNNGNKNNNNKQKKKDNNNDNNNTNNDYQKLTSSLSLSKKLSLNHNNSDDEDDDEDEEDNNTNDTTYEDDDMNSDVQYDDNSQSDVPLSPDSSTGTSSPKLSGGLNMSPKTMHDHNNSSNNNNKSNSSPKNVMFISTDTVSTLHEILNIQELYGINCQALIDLMQRVGEELGMMGLDDEELDDVIPAKVVHLFAENFISGFLTMMGQLGFDRYLSIVQKQSVKKEQPQTNNNYNHTTLNDDDDDRSLSDCDSSDGSYDEDEGEDERHSQLLTSIKEPPVQTFKVNGLSLAKLKL